MGLVEVDLAFVGVGVGIFVGFSGVGEVDVLEAEGGLQEFQLHRDEDGFLEFLGSLLAGFDIDMGALESLDVLLA